MARLVPILAACALLGACVTESACECCLPGEGAAHAANFLPQTR